MTATSSAPVDMVSPTGHRAPSLDQPLPVSIGWTLVAVGALTTIPLVLQLISDDE
jgi:hypothetical protein